MTGVNLLPWRELERAERKKEFFISLGFFCFIAVMVMVPVYLVLVEIISNQQSRNSYLTEQIELLDSKISQIKELQHEELLLVKRMEIIQNLQEVRSQVVHLFDEFVKVMPEGVYVTSILRRNADFVVLGVSDSNAGISKLMRNVDSSPWFAVPMLKEIDSHQDNGVRTSSFELQLQERAPSTRNDHYQERL